MAKRVEKLTNTQVKNAKPKEDGSPQLFSDGGGLFLRASKGADGTVCRTYFFKYTTPERQPNGRHREPSLGLGSADKVSLTDVRRLAREADAQRKAAWRDWKPGDPRPATDPVERKHCIDAVLAVSQRSCRPQLKTITTALRGAHFGSSAKASIHSRSPACGLCASSWSMNPHSSADWGINFHRRCGVHRGLAALVRIGLGRSEALRSPQGQFVGNFIGR